MLEDTVEESVKKLRDLDGRRFSRIYRIGVNGEKHIYYVTGEAQKMFKLILSFVSWV